ncbi:MAG: ATP-dependent DNA helicase RecG, partial [Patescibacteria group bacterium]
MSISENQPLENILRLTPNQKSGLKHLGIATVKDLLRHFPSRYKNYAGQIPIRDLEFGAMATVSGRVIKAEAEKTWKKKINIAKTIVADGTGSLRITWFNQPYMARMLSPARAYTFSGKVLRDKKGLYMANPEYEASEGAPDGPSMFSIYSETYGLSSRWLFFAIQKLLKLVEGGHIKIADTLPQEILARYHLPSAARAIMAIHDPTDEKKAEAARKRFAFEEIFYIQLSRQREKIARSESRAFEIKNASEIARPFIADLPFELTGAQKRATEILLENISRPEPMARLLEGDVGSGKTAVAASGIFAAAISGKQAALMAPTEVVARQHYQELSKLLKPFRLKVGLITSSECRIFPSKAFPNKDTHISKSQFSKWISTGEVSVVIGTHALIQKSVRFKNLALAVVDEQHRFGINQRAKLIKNQKDTVPHLLSMTATPIPRTLALTIYGDLDLTLLDEMPPGRKKVITTVVEPKDRMSAYDAVRQEIKSGRQAFVVCPRINPSEENFAAIEMKTVKEEFEKLSKEIFPEFKLGMLHGQMTPKEKEKSMNAFRDGKTHLLVATSVIEVGVNVPNATVIMIEGADRFGLAQLHQLRGRVLRSTHQPYCFIFA